MGNDFGGVAKTPKTRRTVALTKILLWNIHPKTIPCLTLERCLGIDAGSLVRMITDDIDFYETDSGALGLTDQAFERLEEGA